jgi:hypothetical protein
LQQRHTRSWSSDYHCLLYIRYSHGRKLCCPSLPPPWRQQPSRVSCPRRWRRRRRRSRGERRPPSPG